MSALHSSPAVRDAASVPERTTLTELLDRPEVRRSQAAAAERFAALPPHEREAQEADGAEAIRLRLTTLEDFRAGRDPDPRATRALEKIDARTARRTRRAGQHIARTHAGRIKEIVATRIGHNFGHTRTRERSDRPSARRSRSPDDGGDGSPGSRTRSPRRGAFCSGWRWSS
jgi:hypothetical protein